MSVTPELLKRYHLGLCTAEEQQQIAEWLQDGEQLGTVEKYLGTEDAKIAADTNIRAFLHQKTGQNLTLQKSSRNSIKLFPSILKLAALLAIVFLATLYWTKQKPSVIEEAKVLMKEFVAPMGQKKELMLTDGTVVFLNAGSVLRYPEKFSDSCRKVSLIGEGYFKVKPDKAHPFIIEGVHYTQVRVLGTAFNMRSYLEEENVEVSVMEGKVRFSNYRKEHDGVILLGGQSGSYNNSTKEIKMSDTNVLTSNAWAWKEGVLDFRREPLKYAALKIERWYNVKIQINDQDLSKLRYTGSYGQPELGELLTSMGFVLGFKYTYNKENRTININK